jgi:hypothetical protein
LNYRPPIPLLSKTTVIMEPVVCSIHVVLPDWNGAQSFGLFAGERFFTVEDLTEDQIHILSFLVLRLRT